MDPVTTRQGFRLNLGVFSGVWAQLSCGLGLWQAVELIESQHFFEIMRDGGEARMAGIHEQAHKARSAQAIALFIFGELVLDDGAGDANFCVPIMVGSPRR